MPRHKAGNKSARGNSQNTPRGGRGGGRGGPRLETTFVPFKGVSAAGRGHNGFSLQEEARNTERHQSFWNTDQRLRDTRVSFVSAGTLGATKPEDEDPDLAKMSLEDLSSGDQDEIDATEVVQDDDGVMETEETAQVTGGFEESEPINSFFIDTEGSNAIPTGLPPPQIRPVSPTPSNSSEEVLLFAGRDEKGRGIIRDPRGSRTPAESADSRAMVVKDDIQEQQGHGLSVDSVLSQIIVVEEDEEDEMLGQQKLRRPANSFDSKIRVVEDRIHEQEELLEKVLRYDSTTPPLSKSAAKGKGVLPRNSNRTGRKGRGKIAKDTDDALMADYIANMDPEELEAIGAFGSRELGGDDEDIWVETEASSNEPTAATSRLLQGNWNHSDLEDFDDLSTSDGVMGEVQEILSKRDRHRGVQYLVVWEDQATDEARWVPATTLSSVQALAHIENFEAEEKLVAEFRDAEDESTTDSEEIDDDEGTDDEDEDDDQDLLDRAQAAMTDEKIARLLAKQEEYGMGSDELLLFDDNADGDDDAFIKASIKSIMASKQKRRGKGPNRARGDFPSATLMADAYDGFDVMDFDRPSLKPKSKGRKGNLPIDLSDSELESSMQMAWENDRMKKARRKQQREELRSQGLLSSKFGKPDMKHKYKEGMGIMDVVDEIKTFLKTDHTTLALPPMEKADRKIVHELSLKCNLKSLSKGKGNKRAPVLTKTTRTLLIPDSTFDTQVARLTRRFLPRMDVSGKHASRGPKGFGGGGRGGGFNSAAVSYRDGDIVGGSAPELGIENKGRAMLEKMGWSSGTALGALNNKGIMQPVTHVVKTTKAGLG